jgi:hypothetical protein
MNRSSLLARTHETSIRTCEIQAIGRVGLGFVRMIDRGAADAARYPDGVARIPAGIADAGLGS